MVRHHYELSQESARRKNKLISICDELFPEFTQIFKDPTLPSALALREKFPTPHAIATASMAALCEVRKGNYPSEERLARFQQLAAQSIGTKDVIRQRALVFEQAQLISELKLIREHLQQLETEIYRIVEQSREGKILLSLPPMGPIMAATIIATIGTIANFEKAAELKSYFGWAPVVTQTGTTVDQVALTHGGTRMMKLMMYMMVLRAIRMDGEWSRLYERLVPKKCSYDERTRRYKGKIKVIGRIAGQIISLIFMLLKTDQEVLSKVPPGTTPPEPKLYDPAVHKSHCEGHYQSSKPKRELGKIIQLPKK